MRTATDFTPFLRSSIGFEHLFDLLENTVRSEPANSWPPYDIVRADENHYRINVAVAGFRESDLTITQDRNLLIVGGAKQSEGERDYLYRGIADANFERRFELADHVMVTGANLADGILTIELVRELPEELKPRRIEIGKAQEPARIENQQKQAA